MDNGIVERDIAIDSSGRVVIPKDVRRRYRLSAGTRIELREEGDRLVLVPQQAQTSVVERAGILVFCGRLLEEIPDHRYLRDERFDRLAAES